MHNDTAFSALPDEICETLLFNTGFTHPSSDPLSTTSPFDSTDANISMTDYDMELSTVSKAEFVKKTFNFIINPVFCFFGVFGNFFNIIVLTRPRMQVAMDCSLEKSAQAGLISLATSDMLYCAVSLVCAFFGATKTVYISGEFVLLVRLYGPYIQNVLANSSTWLTVIMAAARYAAICKPLHARHLVGVIPTRIAVIMTFIFWTLFYIPSLWTFSQVTIPCGSHSFVIIDEGHFVTKRALKETFTYLWSSIGYFIPVTILAYCNVHLIRALRESRRVRKMYVYRMPSSSRARSGSRVTPTLIGIVFMFIVLVSPSEIIHFCHYHIPESAVEIYNVFLVVANTLQTINFALNFVLYCILNVQFRETLKGIMLCLLRRNTHKRWKRQRSRAMTMSCSTKTSLVMHSNCDTLLSVSGGGAPKETTRLTEPEVGLV